MAEENKDVKKEELPKTDAPSVASQAEAAPAVPAAPQAAPVQAKAEAAPVKKEKPSNCASCNKSIKKKRWYYRNGKFYCTKVCWANAVKKESAKEPSQENKQ